MLLSKIIKADECDQLECFDFEEIESLRQRPQVQERKKKPAQANQDPLQNLEQMVRQRLLEAERKAQELEQEGYEKGYAQGHQDGIEFGQKSMLVTKEHVERLLDEFQKLPERIFEDYRQWFLHSCLSLARHVIRIELSLRPELVIERIEALLAEVEKGLMLTLYLNPKDLELLQQHTEFFSRLQDSASSLVLKSDTQLERGGCRLENEIQLLDASIETQFALLEENLAHGTAEPANNATS